MRRRPRRWLGVQQVGVLCPDGNGQAVLDRVQEDVVAQDVPLDRLEEGLAAAFQTFEQVGAAEAHQPLARPGQVAEAMASAGVGGEWGWGAM